MFIVLGVERTERMLARLLRINLRLEFSDGVFGILSEFYILNLGSLVPSNLGLMMLPTEGLDQLKIMVYPEYIGY